MPFVFPSEEDKAFRKLLFTPCKTREEVKQWVFYFLNIELPDVCVDPESNSNPLDMVWTCYKHIMYGPENDDASRYLWFSSRFGGKTLCESIIEVMLLLHAVLDITHLAALKRQSQDCQKYIAKFFTLRHLRGILSGDSKAEKVATFYVPKEEGEVNLTEKEWKTLPEDEQLLYRKVSNTVEVIVATIASTNGKHTALLCLDEIDVMANIEAYHEAANIPTPTPRPDGSQIEPLTLLTSTRKFAFGIVSGEIKTANETGLIVKNWNILDVCQACQASRHLPHRPKIPMYVSESLLKQATKEEFDKLSPKEKEKYVRIEAFEGCVTNCKLLPACKTYLATRQTCTSRFLKPIKYVQNQFRANKLDRALAQLLCRKPSSAGLIYPELSIQKHQLSPAMAYERIFGEKCNNQNLTKAELVEMIKDLGEWYGGIDWGFTHLFTFVLGIKLGNVFYAVYAYGESDLSPSQKIDAVARYRVFDPKVWADTEDPAMIKMFRSEGGWRMADWKKGKVASGISHVGMKLQPTLGQDPELFFIREDDEDPHMDLLLEQLMAHHYKIVDGKVTDTPSDEDKDFPDALRYVITNLFAPTGEIIVTADSVPVTPPAPHNMDGERSYDQQSWMAQKIEELTGMPLPVREPGAPLRPPMTIQPLSGSGFSYYAQQNKAQEAPAPKKKEERSGVTRGIVWDFE